MNFQKIKHFLKKPEGFFVVITLIFGGFFMLLIPPLETPDEPAHFLRTYQISQFELLPTGRGDVIGGNLPDSLNQTINLLYSQPDPKFHSEIKYDIHKTAAALHISLNKSNVVFIGGLTSYSPLSYIPQAIAVAIGVFLNLSPMILIYLARLASLGAWIGLMYMAIKVIPFKKWTFAGLGLLPMLIAQGISPGIDAVSVGLGALFVATVIRYRQDAKINTKGWLTLLLLGSLVALTKQTTILVVGIAFILKTNQFDVVKRKAIYRKFAVLVLPLSILALWTLIVSSLNLGGSSSIAGQSNSGQIHYLLQHPLHFFHVLFNTFFTTWGDTVVSSFIGIFGWVDTPLAGGFISAGYILIAAMLFINYESIKKPLDRFGKYVVMLFVGLFILGTCGALYVLYTPVGYPIVYGLQGRYFLLFLFMLVPLFANVNLKTTEKNYSRLVKYGSLLLLVVSVLTIYIRYYITLF